VVPEMATGASSLRVAPQNVVLMLSTQLESDVPSKTERMNFAIITRTLQIYGSLNLG
jgi:hypothetical protein